MLSLALAVILVCIAAGAVRAAPAAEAGVLDLSSWSFERDGSVPLTGQWELYWGRLVDPAALAASQEPSPHLVHVPGSWNDLAAAHGEPGGDGYATYRLRTRLPEEASGEEMALHMPWVFTSYSLWVNGRPVAANGQVGTNPDDAVPQFLPLTVPIGVRSGTADVLDIVIHISNFSHRNGGLWNTPVLGTHAQLARTAVVRQALAASVSGAVFLMAVYHLVMYFVVRRWPEWLFLGLTAFVTAVRTLVTGDHVLGQIVGGLPWGVEIRAEYLTGYLFMIAFMALLHALFPRDVSRLIVRGSQAYGALGVLSTLAAPPRVSSLFIPLSVWVSMALIVYCIFVLLIAWRRRRDGAGPMVAGGVVLLLCLAHDMLRSNLIGFNIYLLPLGMTVLLLFQSLTLARRFSAALRRETALAAENASLLRTVQTQLHEVKQSRRLIARLDRDVRRKIAERLHRSTQNRLLRAWHQLAAAKEMYEVDRQRADELLEQVRHDIDHVRAVDIRQVSHELHPSIVRAGLLPAVESVVARYEDVVSIQVEIDDAVRARDGAGRGPARALEAGDARRVRGEAAGGIPEPIRLVVYRVLEESLGNIQAHAGAASVTIALRLAEPDTLSLTIRDDGQGFDPQAVRPSLGLHTIAASVSSVDGEWELVSAPRQGTRITCLLPLAPAEPPSAPDPGAA